MNKATISLLTATIVAAIPSQQATAATIINDTFSRTGPLDGSFADTGQQWSATGWSTAAGAIRGSGELQVTSQETARLDGLSLQPNSTYRLEVELTVTSGGFSWIGFGFKTPSHLDINTGTIGSMLHRHNPEVQMFVSGSGSQQTVPVAPSFPKTLSIDLETGNTISNSELSWRVNGSEVGARRTIDASAVDGVFITNSGPNALGTITNLSVTSTPTIPEPSSLVLLGLAFPLLASRRRTQ